MAIFDIEKMLMCTFFEGGEGSEKVYALYICINVGIFVWPLTLILYQYHSIITIHNYTRLSYDSTKNCKII